MTRLIVSRLALLSSALAALVFGQTTPLGANFVGYYIDGQKTETLTASGIWSTVGPYARDCPIGSNPCPMPTGCRSNTLMYSGTSVDPCGTRTCFAMTIFASSPNIAPTAMNYLCAPNWPANTVYRNLPATPTSSSSSLRSSNASPSVPSSTANATSAASRTSSASSTPTPEPETSKAWIAGPVIGGLLGLALVGGLMFWLGKRKARRQPDHQILSEQQPIYYGQSPAYPPHQAEKYRGDGGNNRLSELPGQQSQTWELSARPH